LEWLVTAGTVSVQRGHPNGLLTNTVSLASKTAVRKSEEFC